MSIKNYVEKHLVTGDKITQDYLDGIESALLDSTTAINQNSADISNLTTSMASKVEQSTIDNVVSSLKGGVSSSGDTLAKLKTLIDNIENVLTSDDTTLDTLQEVVSYIKSEKGLIDSLTSGKVNVTDIIDDLTHTDVNKPVSANQAKVLKGLLDTLTNAVEMAGTELLEATGYGIVSGLAVSQQSTPNMTVNVASGIIHLSDGTRLTSTGNSSVVINPSDSSRPRKDTIYLNTMDRTIGCAVGDYPSITIGSRTYTITTNAVAGDTVTINGVTFTAVTSGATGNQFNVGADTIETATNLASVLNSNTTISSLYTATSSTNVITLTEKVAGGGNTPTSATKTGTIVISNAVISYSSMDTPVAPTLSADKIELANIYVYKGITSITVPNIIDKRILKENNIQISQKVSNIATYSKNTMVIFGDSITALNGAGDDLTAGAPNYYCMSSFGYFTWANVLLGQRFKVLKNAGISGNTTSQMLARIQTDVLNYNPAYCVLEGGTNDIAQNVDVTIIKNNLLTLCQTLINNNITVILVTVPPSSVATFTTVQKQKIIEVNNFIRSLPSILKNLILVDWFEDLVNPAGIGYATNMGQTDGIHPSVQGAYKMGYRMFSVLDSIILKVSVFSGSNLYDTKNPFTNPYSLGGTTLAPNLSVYAPSATITNSKVARSNGLEWQQVSNSASASAMNLFWNTWSGFRVGQKVSAYIEFEIDSSATNIDNFNGGLLAMNSSSTTLASSYSLAMGGSADTSIRFGQNTVSGIMYIPRFIIPENTAQLMLQFSSNQSGAFRIGRTRTIVE